MSAPDPTENASLTATEAIRNPEAAAAIARRALPLLDLTDLSDACTEAMVDALCRKAHAGSVAAVCVWPQFVSQAVAALRGSPVRIATVINFPAGGEDIERAVGDAGDALADGAGEIDLVLPYRAFLRDDIDLARAMVEAVRDVCGGRHGLKVILKTGMLDGSERVGEASRLALEGGADFIKTSTGKTPVSATPVAAAAMLFAIRERRTGRSAGLKVSGGLRSVSDAGRYLDLADRMMGPDWVSAKTFRLGASSLYAELDAAIRAVR